MRIFVLGLGHLGTITAACMAQRHSVLAYEPRFDSAKHPYQSQNDPGIMHEWAYQRERAALDVVHSPERVNECDLVWVAHDMPICDDNSADVDAVLDATFPTLNHCKPGMLVLVSSQLPAGTMKVLATRYPHLTLVCQPENIRIGRGLADFRQPDRIVIGLSDASQVTVLRELFAPFTSDLLFMSIESAEHVKHAINSYLSATIAFANEFGEFAKKRGANLKDIERAMKSDARIGHRAYLGYGNGPGAHLSRDVRFLASEAGGLFAAIEDAHKRFGAA